MANERTEEAILTEYLAEQFPECAHDSELREVLRASIGFRAHLLSERFREFGGVIGEQGAKALANLRAYRLNRPPSPVPVEEEAP